MKINIRKEINMEKLLGEMGKALVNAVPGERVTIDQDALRDAYELIRYLNDRKEFGSVTKKVDASIDTGIRWIAGKAKYIKEQMRENTNASDEESDQ